MTADQWLSSGTLWAAAGTIVAGVTAIIILQQGIITRRLYIGMTKTALLAATPEEVRKNLRITWEGGAIRDPHVLEVKIISRGRRDIAVAEFNNEPLQIGVGARILAILRTTYSPEQPTFHVPVIEDETLKVGPGAIGNIRRSF